MRLGLGLGLARAGRTASVAEPISVAFASDDPAIYCTEPLTGAGFSFVEAGDFLEVWFKGTQVVARLFPNGATDCEVTVDGDTDTVSVGPQLQWNNITLVTGLSDGWHLLRIDFTGTIGIEEAAALTVTGRSPQLAINREVVNGTDADISYIGINHGGAPNDYFFFSGEVVFNVTGTGFELQAFPNGAGATGYVSVDGGADVQLSTAVHTQWVAYTLFDLSQGTHTVRLRFTSGVNTWALRDTAQFGIVFGRTRSLEPSTLPRAVARTATADGPMQVLSQDASLSAEIVGTGFDVMLSQTGGKWIAVVDGVEGAIQDLPTLSGAAVYTTGASGLSAGSHSVEIYAIGSESGTKIPRIIAVAPTGAGAAVSAPSQRYKGLFLGDSITAANWDVRVSNGGFAYLVSRDLRLSVVNVGVPGHKVADARTQFAAYKAAVDAGTADAPDFVNILIGVNDWTNATVLATFQTQYEGLLTDILTPYPACKILCHNLVTTGDSSAYSGAIADAITAVASANVVLFDDASEINKATALEADGIHYVVPDGYVESVSEWTPDIQSLLGI